MPAGRNSTLHMIGSSVAQSTEYDDSVHVTLNNAERDNRATGLNRKGGLIAASVFAVVVCTMFVILTLTIAVNHNSDIEVVDVAPENEPTVNFPKVTSFPSVTPSISSSPTTNSYQEVQREVLIELYTDLNGVGWIKNTNWNTTISFCEWYGITCNGTGDVTSIKLRVASLSGSLTPNIGKLKSLKELNLGANFISSIIPSEIGLLLELEILNLNQNLFSSTIPISIANLSSLKQLFIGHNSITGTLPTGLCALQGLRHLIVYFNDLTGTLPSELGNLVSLNAPLSMQKNSFTGTIPSELGNLRSVPYMSFRENKLSGSVPDEVCALRELSEGVLSKVLVDVDVLCDCCI